MHRFISPRLLILMAFLLVLEYGLSPFFLFLKGRLDFLYLVILDYAFFGSWERLPFFSLGVGLFRDFLGGHLFGIQALSFALTGYLLSLGVQKLERDNLWVRLGMSFLFVGLTETLSLGLAGWLETSKGFSLDLMGTVFLTTFYTTALAPGFFWFTNRWFRRTPFLKQYELF